MLSGHDGKAVTTQFVLQAGIELGHLHGVHHIIHINPVATHTGFEVLLLQFLLTRL